MLQYEYSLQFIYIYDIQIHFDCRIKYKNKKYHICSLIHSPINFKLVLDKS